MRCFHGDTPACSFEVGHQKWGNYFCWDCGIYAEKCDDITYAYYTDSQSIQSKLDKIKKPTTSQEQMKNTYLILYSNLDKVDLIDELRQRKIKFFHNQTKGSLEKLLVKK